MDFSNLGLTSNPYLNQQVDSTLGDMTKAWNMTQLPAYNNAMVRSGSFGNSGVDQMTQEGARQFQTSLGRAANDMRSSNFWQGANFDANNYWQNQSFDKNVYDTTWSQNQQNFNNGLNLLGLQSGVNTQNLGLGTQIQNTPMNYYQGFGNIANSIGQGYGNSQTSMSAQGSPLMGALGGYQLANSFGKNSAPPVTDGGYSVGQGSAYAGTIGADGMFTPYRKGM